MTTWLVPKLRDSADDAQVRPASPRGSFELEDEELSDLTHGFEEWREHYPGNGGSYLIPWERMLEAQGRSDMIQAVEQGEQAHRYLDPVFGA
ncbi:MAG: hypothetical protein ACP5XB_14030 [Isosphaeraceae bacterium]